MPEKDPDSGKNRFSIPWPDFRSIKNTKRVADYWCAGDCNLARTLPIALFVRVLACSIIDQTAQKLADEEALKELKNK